MWSPLNLVSSVSGQAEVSRRSESKMGIGFGAKGRRKLAGADNGLDNHRPDGTIPFICRLYLLQQEAHNQRKGGAIKTHAMSEIPILAEAIVYKSDRALPLQMHIPERGRKQRILKVCCR